jgi:hypothetical protein
MNWPLYLLAGWCAGIVTAIAIRWAFCYHARRASERRVEAARQLNADILAARFVEHRGELARRRQLREFNAAHGVGNAGVVTLRRDSPPEAA